MGTSSHRMAYCGGSCLILHPCGWFAAPVLTTCTIPLPYRRLKGRASLRTGATVDQFTQTAQAEAERREGYEGQLVAALVICTRPLESQK